MAELIRSLSRDLARDLGYDKSKEELQKSRRKLAFDLEEVNIKLRNKRYKLSKYIMCVMLFLVERNPPDEVDRLEVRKRKLEFKIQEVDVQLR